MGKQWKPWRLIFLGSKLTADGDCIHEIKRFLLLGRIAMTNLNSILKVETLLVWQRCLVKAMVFPVVIYGCESWTITKAECLCFWTMVLEKTLESSLDCKEIKQSILKDINPEYSQDGLMLKPKLQYFGYLMWRVNSLEKNLMLGEIENRRRRGRERMR